MKSYKAEMIMLRMCGNCIRTAQTIVEELHNNDSQLSTELLEQTYDILEQANTLFNFTLPNYLIKNGKDKE